MAGRSGHILLAAGAVAATIGWAEAGKQTLKKPFTYESRGVGSNPVDATLRLKPGGERSFVSRAVLDALQKMEFSVAGKSLTTGEPLQPQKAYETDIVRLGAEVVAAHDQASPNLALWKEVVYGLQYKIRYAIDANPRDRKFVIEVTPVLYQRGGATTRWHTYGRDYSGNFFAGRLLTEIDQRLEAAGGGDK